MLINKITGLNFYGCQNPYINNKGTYIKPIASNPTEEEINKAIEVTENDKEMASGLKGRVYILGEDLVVKKYKQLNDAGARSEIITLDKMYDKGIRNKNLQQGKYAFITNDGETYLITGKISGESPNINKQPFNKKNLRALVNLFAQIDLPKIDKEDNSCKIPMHYDLHNENIKLTNNSAGIIDFECLKYEDLFKELKKRNDKILSCNSNFSDIPWVPSNLRNFEYRTLIHYLLKLNKEERDELFLKYLSYKEDYHSARHKYFKKLSNYYAKNCEYEKFAEISMLAKKECTHWSALKNPSEDVIKAEKIKIQIASFIYMQSEYEKNPPMKINPKQIVKYVNDAYDYFNKMYEREKNSIHRLYWKDCKELITNWKEVIKWMNNQAMLPEDMYKETKKMNKKEKDAIKENRRIQEKRVEEFSAKLTNKIQPVLQEIPIID